MQTNRRNVTVAMMVATFLIAIEGTIVSTAMPRVVSELGGLQLISWVFAVYLLTSTVTTPIYGKLADLFGRRVIFTFGAGLFLIGSMLSGLSQTMHQLIWFRAVQGIGAGAILPTTFTIVGDIYPYEERAKVQGLFSSIWGISGLIGPLVGGFLVDYVSWRWIFYLIVPFALISTILLWLFLKEENTREQERKVDYWGAFTFTVASVSILYALLTGGTTYPWNSPVIISLFVAGFIFLALFARIQMKFPEPLFPLQLLRNPILFVSNLGGFLSSSVLIGINVYLPLWVQGVLGQGATGSGLALLPMSLGWPVGAMLGGRFMLKIGPQRTGVAGMLLILFGSVWLSLVTSTSPYWFLIVIMLIVGFGFGFASTVMTVVVQSAVDWKVRGVATASNTFLRSLGQTMGIAVFGTLFNNLISGYASGHFHGTQKIAPSDLNQLLDPHGLERVKAPVLSFMREALVYGIHNIFLLLAAISLVTLFVTFWLPKQKPEVSAVPQGGLKRA
ncbi:MDR family MFS transporter [Paenactinomyces guangxiensis]|uniref:MFS transporter n=1 Tax=Paenactinomyces guangxiensis TaxID=1490290 RepID=A0A7W1WSX6_9BACL|nr:MDR family MFS transporter [Paenactinomyces guangxiensis]MBA4495389.1 MFS transporter [Paenactinomyces guangxiensis]MBH8592490.1 MFS transporter [Paenactinomyces guangxiensis]